MSEQASGDADGTARDDVLRMRMMTERHDVRRALEAGFDVDEVLWMLDLADPSPMRMAGGEELAIVISDRVGRRLRIGPTLREQAEVGAAARDEGSGNGFLPLE